MSHRESVMEGFEPEDLMRKVLWYVEVARSAVMCFGAAGRHISSGVGAVDYYYSSSVSNTALHIAYSCTSTIIKGLKLGALAHKR